MKKSVPIHSSVCTYMCVRVCVSIGENFGREFSRSRTNKSARYFNEVVAGSKSRSSSSTLSFFLVRSFVRSFFVAHFRILFPVISRRKVLPRIWWRVNSKQRIEDVMPGTKSSPAAGNGNSWQISIQTLSFHLS